ncbi:MAG TPA: hypothetical protein VLL08_32940 [Kineosporiaceae bacterium]|nr:hypothetical protein [Kineosporiaceae bacterium]
MTSVSRKHSSNKGNNIMSNLLLNRKTAVVALAVTALLGGGAAVAYPPGTKLTVAATAAPSTDPAHPNTTDVLVTVSNANPTCATRIQIDNGNEVVLPAGTSTTHVYVTSGSGRHSVTARTVDCTKGSKEHAKSKFVTLDAKATGNATSPVGKNYVVNFTGLDPDSAVTSTATRQGSPMTQLVDSDDVDRRGEATVKFKLKASGTWVITTVITPSGAVNNVTVTVP